MDTLRATCVTCGARASTWLPRTAAPTAHAQVHHTTLQNGPSGVHRAAVAMPASRTSRPHAAQVNEVSHAAGALHAAQ